MTDATKKLLAELEQELEELPEEKQKELMSSYLEDLRRRKQAEEGESLAHPSLAILRDAKLEGLPSDYSDRLDDYLYGTGDR